MRALPLALVMAVVCASSCAARVACAAPAAAVSNPSGVTGKGVRIGDLFFALGLSDQDTVAAIPWTSPSDLDKVVVQPLARIPRPLTVVGRRCEDGSALRFAHGVPWAPPPAARPSQDVIERSTTTSINIAATEPGLVDQYVTHTAAFGGYFIFSAPGPWIAEVRDGGAVIGSFVIAVNARN